ncbi:MAG: TerD family protein [Pseudomonadota bacterium]|nr:TerD family protein [Pseudomonadota bacterium]
MITLAPLDRFDLSQLDPTPKRLKIGLGWKPDDQPQGLLGRIFAKDEPIDLDAACLLLDQTSNVMDMVWYKNLRTRDDSIRHLGDSLDGQDRGELDCENGLHDQESMIIELDKIAKTVQTLLFCVCSHAVHDFRAIKQAHFRMMDERRGDELARFNLAQHGKYTGIVLARLSRNADQGWSLQALGEPVEANTPDQLIESAHQWV